MPKSKYPKKTWKYSNEFKAKAVRLTFLKDVKVKDIAESLDIHPFMLSRWRKEYREGKIVVDKRKTERLYKEKGGLDRIKRLEQENLRLRRENDLLKKWQRYLAERHQNALDSSKNMDTE